MTQLWNLCAASASTPTCLIPGSMETCSHSFGFTLTRTTTTWTAGQCAAPGSIILNRSRPIFSMLVLLIIAAVRFSVLHAAALVGPWLAIRNGWIHRMPRLDNDHPNMDLFFPRAPRPQRNTVAVSSYHPPIGAMYRANEPMPDNHPSVHTLMSTFLPPSHPNVDTLLRAPGQHRLPRWHPPIDDFVSTRPPVTYRVETSSYHPAAD